ncbi:MAG TPA: YciI family protein [Polyangiaceae bacterium]|nr:YciI family protein [Polyangiaceae bacterium]
MKSVVIGVGSGATMDAIMAVYPRHKAVVDMFIARGEVIGIGPFHDRGGNLAIFRSREAAEAFVAQDPFILEGLIASYEIRDWGDQLLT